MGRQLTNEEKAKMEITKYVLECIEKHILYDSSLNPFSTPDGKREWEKGFKNIRPENPAELSHNREWMMGRICFLILQNFNL